MLYDSFVQISSHFGKRNVFLELPIFQSISPTQHQPYLFQCEWESVTNSAGHECFSSYLCTLEVCLNLAGLSSAKFSFSYPVLTLMWSYKVNKQHVTANAQHTETYTKTFFQHCLFQHKSVTCSAALHVTLHSGADCSQIWFEMIESFLI